MQHLIIDGMLHGTGIRDGGNGGYLPLAELNLVPELESQIQNWLEQYEEEHYNGYNNENAINKLDREGIIIAEAIMNLFPDCIIEYYSDAKLERIQINTHSHNCTQPQINPAETSARDENGNVDQKQKTNIKEADSADC